MKTKTIVLALLSIVVLSSFGPKKKKAKKKKSDNRVVLLTTEYGDMKIKLYDETPIHKANFIKLVEEGFYEDLLFHRVINKFMIQGGDPKSRTSEDGVAVGDGGPKHTLDAEFRPNLFHKKGAVAAARTGDNVNPERKSSGSQFYIVHGETFTESGIKGAERRAKTTIPEEHRKVYKTLGGTPHLDQNYTVFGEVIEGLEVIDKIAAVETGQADRPKENVKMNMTLIKYKQKKKKK